MKYSITILFLLFFCSISGIISCKKDGPKPCISNYPFKANFKVGENIYRDTIPETDTILSFNAICQAIENYAEISWQVGNEANRRSGRQISISFGLEQLGSTIPITMYAKSQPDKCFPNKESYDTVTKQITIKYSRETHSYLLPYYPQHATSLAILGLYKGVYQDEPKDSFEVAITYNGPNLGAVGIAYEFNLYNIPKGCFKKRIDISIPMNCEPFVPQLNYKSFYGKRFSAIANTGFGIEAVTNPDCCPWTDGFGVYDAKNDTLRIKEITRIPGGPFERIRYFVGRKVK